MEAVLLHEEHQPIISAGSSQQASATAPETLAEWRSVGLGVKSPTRYEFGVACCVRRTAKAWQCRGLQWTPAAACVAL